MPGRFQQLSLQHYLPTLFEAAAAVLDEEGLVNGEEKKFIGSFYAYGICGVVMQWVTDGMKEQTDEVAQRLRRLARSTECWLPGVSRI